jgi:hypothetical protein
MADPEISADCRRAADDGWLCRVMVRDEDGAADYEVSVSSAELARYGGAEQSPDALVIGSFRFLLEREPRGAILRQFALSVIERYFPDYPSRIVDYR